MKLVSNLPSTPHVPVLQEMTPAKLPVIDSQTPRPDVMTLCGTATVMVGPSHASPSPLAALLNDASTTDAQVQQRYGQWLDTYTDLKARPAPDVRMRDGLLGALPPTVRALGEIPSTRAVKSRDPVSGDVVVKHVPCTSDKELLHVMHAVTNIHVDDLSAQARRLIRLTALFHDIGKFSASFEMHPKVGGEMAAAALAEAGLRLTPEETRFIEILVGHHHDMGDALFADEQKPKLQELRSAITALEGGARLEDVVGDPKDQSRKEWLQLLKKQAEGVAQAIEQAPKMGDVIDNLVKVLGTPVMNRDLLVGAVRMWAADVGTYGFSRRVFALSPPDQVEQRVLDLAATRGVIS